MNLFRASLPVLALTTIVCGTSKDTPAPPSRPAATTASAVPRAPAVTLALQQVASGLDNPVYVTEPASDPRIFVVEQPGRIRIIENGQLLARSFLDITRKVGSGGERGLLSVAFHPQYSSNGYLFVNYTDKKGDTQIDRYSVSSSDRNSADPASAKLVLAIDQPYSNHNGGHNLFGPDGMLYIGMGDGGSQGDPHGNGQNPNVLLGKLLRINVDREPYSIPGANPFSKGGGRGEIWALGLRNPWRFAFDRVSGLLYIADVGQDHYEEIDIVPMSIAKVNYGWNKMEASVCYRPSNCDQTGLQKPAFEYNHENSTCSIIGGFVYRGRKIPEIQGQYFYSDYCNSWLRSISYANGRVTAEHEWPVGRLGSVTSFGEDAAGEMYICTSSGRVYRIVKSAGS